MKIALAQINSWTGNIPFNEQKIKEYIKKAGRQKVRLLIFPEMALNGYPPLDFLSRPFFLQDTKKALKNIHKHIPEGMTVLMGGMGPGRTPGSKSVAESDLFPFNSVFLLQKNKPAKMFSKEYLADYDVFDEKRYFSKGNVKENIFVFHGWCCQILICEELWQNLDILVPMKQKPDLILSLNASPFDLAKFEKRLKTAQKWTKQHGCPLMYVNMVGGQEELIFDGGSFILNSEGQLIHQSPFFEENLHVFDLPRREASAPKGLKQPMAELTRQAEPSGQILPTPRAEPSGQAETVRQAEPRKSFMHKTTKPKKLSKALSTSTKTAQALIFGLREFAKKNGFEGGHLGLSGGLDSAVTACLACEALSAKKVRLFFLPGPWTSSLSKTGVNKMAQKLNCPLVVQSIEELYTFTERCMSSSSLAGGPMPAFDKKSQPDLTSEPSQKAPGQPNKKRPLADITKQNIQARLRSMFLMAYANQNPKSLLLGTANKSELALGYGTLYGDLTGGLLPIGDLFKTEVYALARWFEVPSVIIRRPPSAELTKNQKDEDDLPPYKTLDPILKKLIEQTQDPRTAFEKQIFQRLIKNQFKRKQSPPVLKIKSHSFDRGWRYPFPSP